MYFCKLRLQRIDLPLYGRNVDFGLLFEGVHIARNVEVVVVIGKLLASGDISITLLDDTLCEFALCKAAVGRNDVVNVLLAQPVLVLAILELAAGVDEEYVGRCLGLVEDGDGSRECPYRKRDWPGVR